MNIMMAWMTPFSLHFARCTDSPCRIEHVKIQCLKYHSSLARTSRWMDSNSGSLAQRASDTTDWKVGLARSQRLHCLFTLHTLYHAQSETQARVIWKQGKSSRANAGASNFASSLGSQNSASICLPTLEGRATKRENRILIRELTKDSQTLTSRESARTFRCDANASFATTSSVMCFHATNQVAQ